MPQIIQSHFVGNWRILEMDAWDAGYFDMEEPVHITIRENLSGEFQFGLVQGDIDGRVETVNGVPRFDFSWSGFDENDPAIGRGWLCADGNNGEGHIFIHMGDDSGLKAVRE